MPPQHRFYPTTSPRVMLSATLTQALETKNLGIRFFVYLKTCLHTQCCTSIFCEPQDVAHAFTPPCATRCLYLHQCSWEWFWGGGMYISNIVDICIKKDYSTFIEKKLFICFDVTFVQIFVSFFFFFCSKLSFVLIYNQIYFDIRLIALFEIIRTF